MPGSDLNFKLTPVTERNRRPSKKQKRNSSADAIQTILKYESSMSSNGSKIENDDCFDFSNKNKRLQQLYDRARGVSI